MEFQKSKPKAIDNKKYLGQVRGQKLIKTNSTRCRERGNKENDKEVKKKAREDKSSQDAVRYDKEVEWKSK